MAPSGAGRRLVCCSFFWMLAALGWANAGPNATTPVGSQCSSLDDRFTDAFSLAPGAFSPAIVTLGAGCHNLQRNFACTPVRTSVVVDGVTNGTSVWDTDFGLFELSVEPNVTFTLRNLVLARALVFTVGYGNLQPSIFHLRPGSRLVLQNVTVQTLCSTIVYYTTTQGLLPSAQTVGQSNQPNRPMFIPDLTFPSSGMTLQNVTVACENGVSLPGPVGLFVHTAPMLTAFVSASSALTITSTICVMENITLPYVASYDPDHPDPRVALITNDIFIDAANSSGLTYIDANYTGGWMYVQPPARLTLRRLVVTRLRTAIWAPGVMNGLLAGGLPVFMVQNPSTSGNSQPAQPRAFEDVTLVMPQYEIVQVSYWCYMLNMMASEVNHVADFLRSLVWYSDCDVLDSTRLMLRKVRSTNTLYARVQLTSVAPPGVPGDADELPPEGSSPYEHVTPPLYFVSTGLDWADALAPLLPQDTWASLAPAPGNVARPSVSTPPAPAQLPALLLLNGTVTLTLADLRVPGGGKRVVRRSVVVTSMRRGCGADVATCAPAVLDMGNFLDAVRLEDNITVVFQGLTLRNITSTMTQQRSISPADQAISSFFMFDRSSVQIVYENVNVELRSNAFAALYRVLSTPARGNIAGDVAIISMNASFIQFASFQLGGARASYVNFTMVPGDSLKAASLLNERSSDAQGGSGGGGGGSNTGVVVGAVVGGTMGLLLLLLAGLFLVRRQRTRQRATPFGSGGVSASEEEGNASVVNSSDTALAASCGNQVAPSTTLPVALAGASGPMAHRTFSLARSVPEEDALEGPSRDSSGRGERTSPGSGSTSVYATARRFLLDPPASADAAMSAQCTPPAMRSLLDPSSDVSGSGAAAVAVALGGGAVHSGAFARRMSRAMSGGRTHLLVSGESGRPSGLRVRAAMGRSPSRTARSAASSNSGPSCALPAPPPAMLSPSDIARVTAGTAGTGGAATPQASGSTARLRSDRMAHLYQSRSAGQRRELSNPILVAGSGGGGGGTTAVSEPVGEVTASHSAQLTATAGTLDPHSGHPFDADSSSPGASTSISKMPEPASEVQRLILELSAQGTDQLVVMEPIGQGGYGTVYRGVWRNLDVAVKTVLFQDRANLGTSMPCPAPGTASLTQSNLVQTAVIEEGEEGVQQQPASRPDSGTHASLGYLATAPGSASACGSGCFAGTGGGGSLVTVGGGGGGGNTHNWMLASQQAANSGSLPTVNMGGAAAPAAAGPLGVASQQRAVLEAAVSCSVAHPNVVATYHYDITSVRPSGVVCSGGLLVSDGVARGCAGVPSDWKLYLVQEFCDAGSLANALDLRVLHDPVGMPNLALTLCTLADIARGMAHIHSRSIVHGDLNPTNILLRTISGSNGGIVPMWNRVTSGGVGPGATGGGGPGATGGGGSGCATPGGTVSSAANLRHELGVTLVAKVADFGLCGMLAPGKRHISNALRGTPFYTAPETVATGTLTKASDVFSFGVIAWEVYTGRPPFQHSPEQGFVRDDSFPRMPPHVPPTFANMALACLSSDPDVRPTFDQILDRLMSLQSKLAISLQQRLSRLVASNGALVGAAGSFSPLGPFNTGNSPHASLAPATGGSCGPGPGSGLGMGLGMGRTLNMLPVTLSPPQSTQSGLMPPAGGSGFMASSGSLGMGILGPPNGPTFANSVPNIQPLVTANSPVSQR